MAAEGIGDSAAFSPVSTLKKARKPIRWTETEFQKQKTKGLGLKGARVKKQDYNS